MPASTPATRLANLSPDSSAASAAANTALPLADRLQHLLALLAKTIPYDTASVALLRGQPPEPTPITAHTPADGDVEPILARHALFPVLSEWAEQGQTVLIEDAAADARWQSLADPESIGAYLGIPLHGQTEVVGVLHITSRASETFGADYITLAEAYAGLMAIVVENVHLARQVDQRADELRLLTRMAQVISSLDLEAVLEVTYEEISAAFDTRTFFIALYDESLDQLDFRIAYDDGVRLERFQRPMSESASVTAWIVENRQPLLAQDMKLERNHLPARGVSRGAETRAWMGVPLIYREELIGVISVQAYKPGAYQENDLNLLQAIANQVAVAICNAIVHEQSAEQATELARSYNKLERSYEELDRASRMIMRKDLALSQANEALDRRADRLLAVHQLQRKVIRLNEPAAIYKAIAETVIAEMSMDVCLVVDVAGEELRLLVQAGSTSPGLELADLLPAGAQGLAAQTGEGIFVPDVAADPDWAANELCTQLKLRSFLAAPINLEGRVQSVIMAGIQTPSPGIEPEDLEIFSLLASLTATAVENAVFTDKLVQRLREMSTLHELSQQVTSSLEVESVLQTVADTLRQASKARAAAIHLLDPETDELIIRAAAGIQERWLRVAKLKVGEGIAGRVALTAQPSYVPDAHNEPNFIFFDQAVRSLLVVPLTVKGRVIGTFSIDSDTPNAFTSDDERFLTIAAAQAAVAIENAQLYADLKSRYLQLQELDKLKDELVQNVSHELRTPLTFLRSYIELLLDGQMGSINETQRHSLEIVSAKTQTLTRLVGDIVSSEQIESSNLRTAYLDILDVARMAIAGATLAARAQQVHLKLDVQDSPPKIPGDRDRLSQVFDNLLGNAIKFSPLNGTVTVRLQRTEKRPGVLVSVTDEGIGIPQTELESIFQRFYQVDGSPSRRYGGVGLGLAIVKRIVDAHGGQIWVESEAGQGSTFFVRLPAESPAAPESTPVPDT